MLTNRMAALRPRLFRKQEKLPEEKHVPPLLLCLADNRLSRPVQTELTRALQGDPAITAISLRGVKEFEVLPSNEKALLIFQMFPGNRGHITSIDLAGCCIDGIVASAIQRALFLSKSLCELDLSSHKLTVPEVLRLLRAIPYFTRLRVLNVALADALPTLQVRSRPSHTLTWERLWRARRPSRAVGPQLHAPYPSPSLYIIRTRAKCTHTMPSEMGPPSAPQWDASGLC